jgi:hypothetical protein
MRSGKAEATGETVPDKPWHWQTFVSWIRQSKLAKAGADGDRAIVLQPSEPAARWAGSLA